VGDDEGWKKPLSSGACRRLAAGPPSAPSANFLDARHHDGAGCRWRGPHVSGAFARAKLIDEVIVAVEPVLVVRGLALLLGGAPDLRLDLVDIVDRRRPPFVGTTAWQSLTLRSSRLGLRSPATDAPGLGAVRPTSERHAPICQRTGCAGV
jgi:hypothetical protein